MATKVKDKWIEAARAIPEPLDKLPVAIIPQIPRKDAADR